MAPSSGLRRAAALLIVIHLLLLVLPPPIRPSLLYTDSKSILLLEDTFSSTSTSTSSSSRAKRPNTTVILDHDLIGGYALDFDWTDQIVFWADQALEMIRGFHLADRRLFDVIRADLNTPESIAVDWISKKIYFADSGLNRIEVANYNGSQRAVLISKDIEASLSIALVPEQGFIFFSDCGHTGKIERSSMDGDSTTRTVIIEDKNNCFSGLTIDYASRRLYWFTIPMKSDLHEGHIQSSDFFGHERRSHACNPVSAASPRHRTAPFRSFMTISTDETLFWTDKASQDIHWCSLKTEATGQANLRQRRRDDDINPHGIKWFNATAQPKSLTNCSHNNGDCSHLCLLSSIGPRFYSCACPIGMKLLEDGRTCSDHDSLLLIARSGDLRKISLDTLDYTSVILRKTKQATLIDYDPIEAKIYWSDETEKLIKRAPLNGSSDPEVVIDSYVGCLEAIAIDPVARNIYWTECEIVRIEVAKLDGSARKVLLEDRLEKPRALALHPAAGLMFWSDWGASPKIERAYLDGTSRRTIIDTKIFWPNGLAVDLAEERLYWGDARAHTIEWCHFDGSSRTVVWKDKNIYIFGFTILGDWIYFSDRQKRMIKAVDKNNGQHQRSIVDEINNQLPDWMGIKAANVKPAANLTTLNPCGGPANGNCSHFCFNRPQNEYVCDCPLGYHLVGGRRCAFDEPTLVLLKKHEIEQLYLSNATRSNLATGIGSARAFDVDMTQSVVYWADAKAKTISRSAGVNGPVEVILKLQADSKVEDLAIDWLANQLYWVDSAARKLEVSRGDGLYRKVLHQFAEGFRTKAVAVDPIAGQLFTVSTERPAISRIDRFLLDGTKASKAPVISHAKQILSLTIDYEDRRLLWLDEGRNIDSCRYDGSQRRYIKVSDDRPSSISIFKSNIYLLDSVAKAIKEMNKVTAESSTVPLEISADSLEVVASHRVGQKGWNCCATRNAGCQQLCFYKPRAKRADNCDVEEGSSVVCGCKVHYRLNEKDSRTCLGPESFLLYSHQSTHLTRFLFNTKSAQDYSETEHFTLPNSTSVITAISYDALDDKLYWIDSGMSIQRKRFNESTAQVIIQSASGQPELVDLVIHPISRMLYWTSGRSNSINATRLIGQPTAVGVVHLAPGDKPRLLAMHLRKNLLFWTNDQPKFPISQQHPAATPPHKPQYTIYRTTFTPALSSTPTTSHDLPITSLAIEPDLNYLIFTSGSFEIYYSDLQGQMKKRLHAEAYLRPIALATHSKYLFWLDAHERSIAKISLDFNYGTGKQTIYEGLPELHSIIAVTPLRKSQPSLSCVEENGGCSHICLIVDTSEGTESTCACPQGLILHGTNCTEPVRCSPLSQFTCTDGLRCLDLDRHCDGNPDCNDGSDEVNCLVKVPAKAPAPVFKSHATIYFCLIIGFFCFIGCILFVSLVPCLRGHVEKTGVVPGTAVSGVINANLEFQPYENVHHVPPSCAISYQMANNTSEASISIAYPTATGNPPPSPATVRSASIYSTTNSRAPVYPLPPPASRKLRKCRPKKASKTRSDYIGISGTGRTGPPPSLCGSDTYDYLSPPTSVKYELYENVNQHLDYIPPAPTPRHYFSDPSCPPSPGTEHSFCTFQNLVPPHPSPVPEGDY